MKIPKDYVDVINMFNEAVSDFEEGYWEAFVELDHEDTFEFQGRTIPRTKTVIEKVFYTNEEKVARVFGHSPNMYAHVYKAFSQGEVYSPKLLLDDFMVMKNSYVEFLSAKRLDHAIFGDQKQHKEMFKALWPMLTEEYWFMGCKFSKGEA